MRTPSLKKVDSGIGGLFEVLRVSDSYFYPLWHYHPQYEIILIKKGIGDCYIGDNIRPFNEGEIFLLGPDIPHIFRNSPEYFIKGSRKKAEATVLYFNYKLVRSELFNLNEFINIRELLQQSKRGLIIKGIYKKPVAHLLNKVVDNDGINQILEFISMLHFIATKVKYDPISSIGFTSSINEEGVPRLNKVFDYLLNNFSRTITLKEVADISNMSPSAFCRYFKKITNKTLITYLNEIRVGHACKLIIGNRNKNISQICNESGFNNLTNFYIQFRNFKNLSPSEFKQKYNF
ncbi:MAG TPA: AraC family transcriptional regulator [Bacteroidales bacterium]|nr:AraC family transcriptional regulator [Bacteroidales bacterium]